MKFGWVLVPFYLILSVSLAGCAQPASLPISLPLPTETVTATSVPPTPLSPTATDTPVACQQMSGTIQIDTIPSKLSKWSTEVRVYLPPCYDAGNAKGYPVLYMLHGQTYGDSQWQNLGLTTAADQLITAKQIAPLIIVMPNEEESMSDAETSPYGNVLIDEVLPWIDEHYATCKERDCRGIGGLSRGGNWAVRVGLTHPDLFAVIGAHSTPLFYGDLDRIPGWINAIPAGETPPMIYIDFGKSDEEKNEMLKFGQVLNKLGIMHQLLQLDGFHDAAYWSAHVADYLLWYSASFAAPRVIN